MPPFHRLTTLALVASLLLAASAARAAQPARQSTRLAYDEVVRGRLSEGNPEQRWQFTGQAGDRIVIDMRARDATVLDPYLTLLDPAGNSLASDDDSGEDVNARIGPLRLPAAGEYTIVAARYTGAGDYILELKDLSTIAPIAVGKPLVGVLDASHPNDYFLLPAGLAGGDLLRLEIADEDASSDPFLTVYGPDGYVTGTELQEDTSRLDPLVPLPGEDYVIVVSWHSDSAGGPYELLLATSQIALLADGVAQSARLNYATYMQRHYFQATQGDTLHIQVTAEGDISPALEIVSMDLNTYLFSGEGATVRGLALTLRVPLTAVYVIEMRNASLEGGSGTYTVQIDWLDG